MKTVVKYTLVSILALIMLGAMVFAYVASSAEHAKIRCTSLNIEITDSAKLSFIGPGDVRAILKKEYGKYLDIELDSINLVKIEKLIDSRSAVQKSQAYTTPDGKLNIKISQREPVIRFQRQDGGFYADKDGNLFPLQRNHTAHVPVIDGHIPLKGNSGYRGVEIDSTSRVWVKQMIAFMDYIDGTIWEDNIVQVHVNRNGDLVLIPREGKEQFIFGQPYNLEEKFEQIEKYYTCVRPSKEDGYYKSVNVKYRKQLICRR